MDGSAEKKQTELYSGVVINSNKLSMVKYVQTNRHVANDALSSGHTKDTNIDAKATKRYMCGCGSYISVKGKLKHEQTEKHLISTDIEPPIENIDGLPDMPLPF